jgi:hypothetical protein
VIRYSRGKLEEQLDKDTLIRVADELRALEASPLMFRFQQKLQTIRDGLHDTLGKASHPPYVYHAASGGLAALDMVFEALEEIIVEGTKKRNE